MLHPTWFWGDSGRDGRQAYPGDPNSATNTPGSTHSLQPDRKPTWTPGTLHEDLKGSRKRPRSGRGNGHVPWFPNL